MKYVDSDIKKLGTILGIWAHPDDESWASAGIMITAAANGQRTACVTATKGEAGETDEKRWPKKSLAETREYELNQALKIMNCKEHYWLDYGDGSLKSQDEKKAVATIEKIIRSVGPDTILTFGPDGLTGHDDHRTISRWTGFAAKKADSHAKIFHLTEVKEHYESLNKTFHKEFNVYFNIKKPKMCSIDETDLCYRLPEAVHAKKLEALKAQASQTYQFFENPDAHVFLRENTKCECYIKKSDY